MTPVMTLTDGAALPAPDGSRRPRFLRKALDPVLDLFFRCLHQIGKLVDDEHDLRKTLFIGQEMRIVFIDIAYKRNALCLLFEQGIAALHLIDAPVQDVDDFRRFVYDLIDHQMRQRS